MAFFFVEGHYYFFEDHMTLLNFFIEDLYATKKKGQHAAKDICAKKESS